MTRVSPPICLSASALRPYLLSYFMNCFRPIVLLALTAASAGCDEEKPYTPFQVATELPEPSRPPQRDLDPAEKIQEERPILEQKAPRGATQWKVFGRKLSAPPDTIFQSAIESPADQSEMILAWLLPRDKSSAGPNAGLWSFSKEGQSSLLKPLPEYLPRGKDCLYRGSLEKSGEQTVTARVKSECTTRLLPGTPTQSLVILSPDRSEPELMHFRLREPAAGEDLDIVVNSSDRDGDGADDVELLMSLTGPNGIKETLPFRWLSRTAGASRQAESPAKELATRASRLMTGSIRKAERAKVPKESETLLRLIGAVCSEFSTMKIERGDGSGVPCGDLQPSLSRLNLATAQAYAGSQDPESALGVLERASWIGKKPSEKEHQALSAQVLKSAKHLEARQLARFDVKTKSLSTPFGHPLHFTQDGQLWAATPDDKTKRLTMRGDPPLITPATDDEPEKRIEAPSWSFIPLGPGGKALSAALPSCERSEVQLAFSQPSGAPQSTVPIPFLAPRPGNCRTYTGTAIEGIPLFWDGGQLGLVLGGELISSAGQPRTPPFPVAWGTSLGVALRQGTEFSIWTGEAARRLHHCAVSPGAKKIACVRGESVIVLGPPLSD